MTEISTGCLTDFLINLKYGIYECHAIKLNDGTAILIHLFLTGMSPLSFAYNTAFVAYLYVLYCSGFALPSTSNAADTYAVKVHRNLETVSYLESNRFPKAFTHLSILQRDHWHLAEKNSIIIQSLDLICKKKRMPEDQLSYRCD